MTRVKREKTPEKVIQPSMMKPTFSAVKASHINLAILGGLVVENMLPQCYIIVRATAIIFDLSTINPIL